MNQLTLKQSQVLEFIRAYCSRNDRSPSHVDIMREFGFASRNAAYHHVDQLVKKGYLKKDLGVTRSIVLVGNEPPAVIKKASKVVEDKPAPNTGLTVNDYLRGNY